MFSRLFQQVCSFISGICHLKEYFLSSLITSLLVSCLDGIIGILANVVGGKGNLPIDSLIVGVLASVHGVVVLPVILLFYLICGKSNLGLEVSLQLFSIVVFNCILCVFYLQETGIVDANLITFIAIIPLINQRISKYKCTGFVWLIIFLAACIVCFSTEFIITDFEKLSKNIKRFRFLMTMGSYTVGMYWSFSSIVIIFFDNLAQLKGKRLLHYLSRRMKTLDFGDFDTIIGITNKKYIDEGRYDKVRSLDKSFCNIVTNLERYRSYLFPKLSIIKGKKKLSEKEYLQDLKEIRDNNHLFFESSETNDLQTSCSSYSFDDSLVDSIPHKSEEEEEQEQDDDEEEEQEQDDEEEELVENGVSGDIISLQDDLSSGSEKSDDDAVDAADSSSEKLDSDSTSSDEFSSDESSEGEEFAIIEVEVESQPEVEPQPGSPSSGEDFANGRTVVGRPGTLVVVHINTNQIYATTVSEENNGRITDFDLVISEHSAHVETLMAIVEKYDGELVSIDGFGEKICFLFSEEEEYSSSCVKGMRSVLSMKRYMTSKYEVEFTLLFEQDISTGFFFFNNQRKFDLMGIDDVREIMEESQYKKGNNNEEEEDRTRKHFGNCLVNDACKSVICKLMSKNGGEDDEPFFGEKLVFLDSDFFYKLAKYWFVDSSL